MSNGPTAIPVSPVNDMVLALQEALASHAKVPDLERSIRSKNDQIDQLAYYNQRMEENIIGYKNQIVELTSKVRSLEVERDDAGFRLLETEDKLNSLLGFMRNATTAMDDEIRFIDPPKPVPSVVETPKADEVKGQSDTDPTASSQNEKSAEPLNAGEALANDSDTANGIEAPYREYRPFTPPSPEARLVEISEGKDMHTIHIDAGPYKYWDKQ